MPQAPWEKYKTTDGPWAKYRSGPKVMDPPAIPRPELPDALKPDRNPDRPPAMPATVSMIGIDPFGQSDKVRGIVNEVGQMAYNVGRVIPGVRSLLPDETPQALLPQNPAQATGEKIAEIAAVLGPTAAVSRGVQGLPVLTRALAEGATAGGTAVAQGQSPLEVGLTAGISGSIPVLGSMFRRAVGTPQAAARDTSRQAAIQSAERRGIPLTAGDRTDPGGTLRNALLAGESSTGRTVFGRGPLQTVAQTQSDMAIKQWWEPEILDQIAPYMDPGDIGALTQKALGQRKGVEFAHVSKLFDKVSHLAANVQVDDAKIRNAALRFITSPELGEAMKRAPSLADDASLKTLRELAMTVEGAPTMPYGTAEIIRKQIEKVVRDAGHVSPAVGKLKYLSGQIESAMDDALNAQAPHAHKLWRAARSLYKPRIEDLGSMGKDFEAKVLQRIAKAHPEDVVNEIMKSGLSGIETAKKYLQHEPVWNNIQRRVLENAMSKHMTTESARGGAGLIQGQQWHTYLEKNMPALSRVLDKDTMGQVDEFVNTVKRFRNASVRAGNPSESGSALIAQAELGTLLTATPTGLALMATGNPEAGAAAIGTAGMIALGPRTIAHILASQGGAKLLSDGLRIPRGTEASRAIAARLLTYTGSSANQESQ